ncbi:MAG: tetratricopeptide repeat protein [Syntrophales bacterium]|nr:tetratricopeptide repeat protein [Syntrophales bacterium]MDY0044161.1 tetratricopeptide repeat protein [Syntrophales bacterium]
MASRTSKKNINSPDELQTISRRLIEFILSHRRQAYLYTGIFAAVVIIVAGWHLYTIHYEAEANEMYAKAYSSYAIQGGDDDSEDVLKKAAALYEELVKEYVSSDAAVLAYYNLGNIHYTLGDTDKSIEAYKMFLRSSDETSMLRSLAFYSLGYAYEVKGEYEQALKSFENSEKSTTGIHFKTINYANIGRIYEKMDNIPKALEYYGKVNGEDVDPFMKGLMKTKIASLNQEGSNE